MLALIAPIKNRLQALAPLAAWQVRTNTEDADRAALPMADVRCIGAGVSSQKAGAVVVEPQWTVVLVLRRGGTASAELDAALQAVIGALHGWQPGQHGGLGWEPLALQRISEPILADEGLVGYELTFSTQALYRGQE